MEFIIENWTQIIAYIFGGGSLVGWFLDKKKRKAQDNQEEADALVKMREAYKMYVEDSTEKYKELKEDYLKIVEKCDVMQADLQKLLIENHKLKLLEDGKTTRESKN